ncbi:MAG: DUF4276 family protein [Acidobacteria bacterium]|nr:DUF4276 family protein [Acidobacteriota bacterium]
MIRRVLVYVEGPSDKYAMINLLAPLIDRQRRDGVDVLFFEAPPGDRKASLLTKVPHKAVNILANDRQAIVAVLPDLYPKNKAYKHETFDELARGLFDRFDSILLGKHIKNGDDLRRRFKVHCFKHDLEALMLAAEDALKARLEQPSLKPRWRVPVDDQDHDRPPKMIVTELFQKAGRRYHPTIDAPLILGASNYLDIADKCPQCFRPFVQFLLDPFAQAGSLQA